ncbi:MAG: hypothetical protein QXQ53_04820 [Candidatus Methanosuratincola sp.]
MFLRRLLKPHSPNPTELEGGDVIPAHERPYEPRETVDERLWRLERLWRERNSIPFPEEEGWL